MGGAPGTLTRGRLLLPSVLQPLACLFQNMAAARSCVPRATRRRSSSMRNWSLGLGLFWRFRPIVSARRGVAASTRTRLHWLRRKPERTTGSCCEAASSTPRGGSAGAGSTWSYEEPVQPTWGCLLANRCRVSRTLRSCKGLDTGLVRPGPGLVACLCLLLRHISETINTSRSVEMS